MFSLSHIHAKIKTRSGALEFIEYAAITKTTDQTTVARREKRSMP